MKTPKISKAIDEIDEQILLRLSNDGRISMSDLASQVGLSAPSVTERVRHLQQHGIIRSISADIDWKALGYVLEAIVRIKPRPGELHKVEAMIDAQPRFTHCDKVTGEDCFVTRLLVRDIGELDPLLDPFHDRAETNTAIVKSSPLSGRLPPLLEEKGFTVK
ncbi:Lrp/AsnC family transcriptional regulator [Cohaesibacter celericrescens]|uniref:AsnC family transcriptional regulator n=1 Tax=Cohaesibacter celericrescens TaxID=2067669 RepID=A0A2N5XR67_9HYPH|nr:Lrp/AsnC family transcriptional regulator [Cohaesibacter celericrescens]PLW77012.1 AsnC family transcriptional regulator [Cohaesibacter celericrescens]